MIAPQTWGVREETPSRKLTVAINNFSSEMMNSSFPKSFLYITCHLRTQAIMALNKSFILLRKYIKYKNREPLKLEGSRIIYVYMKAERASWEWWLWVCRRQITAVLKFEDCSFYMRLKHPRGSLFHKVAVPSFRSETFFLPKEWGRFSPVNVARRILAEGSQLVALKNMNSFEDLPWCQR